MSVRDVCQVVVVQSSQVRTQVNEKISHQLWEKLIKCRFRMVRYTQPTCVTLLKSELDLIPTIMRSATPVAMPNPMAIGRDNGNIV